MSRASSTGAGPASSDENGGGRAPSLQRGCALGIIVLFLLVSGLGYMWWQAYNKFNPPAELREYAYRASLDSIVDSKAPARSDSAPLDAEEILFFMGAVDTVWSVWSEFDRVYDSAYAETGADEEFDPLEFDEVGTLFWRIPLLTRRGLIDHLNKSNRSWEEYIGIKQRVVAAADISQREATDSLHALMRRYHLAVAEEGAPMPNDDLFRRTLELRPLLDSTEKAMAAPLREDILRRGVQLLVGTDEAFYGEE